LTYKGRGTRPTLPCRDRANRRRASSRPSAIDLLARPYGPRVARAGLLQTIDTTFSGLDNFCMERDMEAGLSDRPRPSDA
jgi:hypothetical protein